MRQRSAYWQDASRRPGRLRRSQMTVTPFRDGRACPQELRRRDALDALSDTTQWVLATLRAWWRRSHERDELARLDDRMLQDIGLSNGERDFLANKWFWRE